MNFDKNTGVIEMFMDALTPADEGTFTFQLKDGKATNQSSLVLIGNGTKLNKSDFKSFLNNNVHFIKNRQCKKKTLKVQLFFKRQKKEKLQVMCKQEVTSSF